MRHFRGAYTFENVLNFADQSDIEFIKELQTHISTHDPINIQFTSVKNYLSAFRLNK